MKQFNKYIFEKLKIASSDTVNNFLLDVFNSKSPNEFKRTKDILLNYINDNCFDAKLVNRNYHEYILDPSLENNNDTYIYVGEKGVTFGTFRDAFVLYYSNYYESVKVLHEEEGFASFVTTGKKLIADMGVFIVNNEYSLLEQIEQLKSEAED